MAKAQLALIPEPRTPIDLAIEAAGQNADPDWMSEAIDAVIRLSLRLRYFTSDDIWAELVHCDVTTHEPRALGAVMRTAAKEGWCAPTEHWRQSGRRACHSRPLRVWRSLVE